MGECGAWELEHHGRWTIVGWRSTARIPPTTWCGCGEREDRAHAGPPGGRTPVEAAADRALCACAGGQTGAQAVQMVQAGLKAIYVSGWQVAGDTNTAQQTYPDQSLYPADSVPTLVRRINNALQRADQIAKHADHRADALLVCPVRGRRRGGFRRHAQRLRVDEGHDRGRGGRGPLRRPTLLVEEMRPHGRQGAGAHPGGGRQAHRRPAGRRRAGRPHADRRPYRCLAAGC